MEMATSTIPNNLSSSPHSGQSALRLTNPSSASEKHRQSFSELRYPPSPRSHRQPSLPSLAVQELIDNPPPTNPDPKFAGRDWRTIKISELTSAKDLRFVEVNTPVEIATNVSRSLLRPCPSILTMLAINRYKRPGPPRTRTTRLRSCRRHLRLQYAQRIPAARPWIAVSFRGSRANL